MSWSNREFTVAEVGIVGNTMQAAAACGKRKIGFHPVVEKKLTVMDGIVYSPPIDITIGLINWSASKIILEWYASSRRIGPFEVGDLVYYTGAVSIPGIADENTLLDLTEEKDV